MSGLNRFVVFQFMLERFHQLLHLFLGRAPLDRQRGFEQHLLPQRIVLDIQAGSLGPEGRQPESYNLPGHCPRV